MSQRVILQIKRFFTNNFSLKAMALLFSLILWILVVNVDDPTQTKTFTTAVSVLHEEALASQGKYYILSDQNRTVSFRVTARRSVIERLSGSDFLATADLEFLDANGRVPVKISYQGNYSNVTISAKQIYLTVDVGEEMTTKYQVEVEVTGEPATGCVVGETSVEPGTVTVTGPVEQVREISRVVTYVDVTDASEDLQDTTILRFLDASGNEMNQSRLRVDRDQVTVRVTMTHKKSVPIEIETKGSLVDGLTLEGISLYPNTVEITGTREVLNGITSIVIPDSLIDLSKITEDMTTTVDLTSYLPEGVSLADSNAAQVRISVNVSGKENRTFSVPVANVKLENLPDGFSANITNTTINVNVSGDKKNLDKITAADFTGTVDLSNLEAGNYSLDVVWDKTSTLDGVTVEPIKVSVTMAEQ